MPKFNLQIDIDKSLFAVHSAEVITIIRETTTQIDQHFKTSHGTITQSVRTMTMQAQSSYRSVGEAALESGERIQEHGRNASHAASEAAEKLQDLSDKTQKSTRQTEQQGVSTDKAAKSVGDLGKKVSENSKEVEKSSEKHGKFGESLKRFGDAGQEAYKKLKEAGAGANGVSEAIGAAAGALTGLPIGPAVELLNTVKDSFLELDRVAQATGLGADKIVELEDVIEQAGGATKDFPEELQKLSGSMNGARDGAENSTRAFHELGISTAGWKNHLPSLDQVLLQVSDHIKNSTNPTRDLAAVTELFGEKGKDLIPVLREGSAAIRQQMKDHEDHGKAALASINSARQLQAAESRLAEELQKILLPVFQAVVFVLRMFIAGLYKVWAGIKILIALFVDAAKISWAFAQAIYDVFQALKGGDFSGAIGRMKDFMQTFKQQSDNTVKYIKDTWEEGNRQADEVLADHVDNVGNNQNQANTVIKEGTKRQLATWKNGNKNILTSNQQAGQDLVENNETMLGAMVTHTAEAMRVINNLMLGMGTAPPPRLADDHGVQATRKAEKQKEEIVKKSVDYRQELEKSLSKNIQSFFSSSIMGMIQGTETLASAVAKLGQQMLQNFVDVLSRMVSDWIEQHIIMKIFGIKTSQETAQADIQASSASGAAAAGSSAAKLPFGWLLVPSITMAVFGMLSAFKGHVNSAAGGFYEVDRDQLAMIHKKEMVLPAGIAERLRSAVGGDGMVGSGVSVNVYHNVNAIDAASFKDTIKQHSNIIGNEVVRVLKRKGLAEK